MKAIARNVWWSVRGLPLRNPPFPTQPASFLFVCHGNICRSPFAAALAEQRLVAAGRRDVRCSSAGLYAVPGTRPPATAVEAAARFGVDLQASRSELLTDRMLQEHDVVLVMEPAHLQVLTRRWPLQAHRFFLLPHFSPGSGQLGAYARHHLVDPYGRDLETFLACYRRIDVAVGTLVARVTGGAVPAASRSDVLRGA